MLRRTQVVPVVVASWIPYDTPVREPFFLYLARLLPFAVATFVEADTNEHGCTPCTSATLLSSPSRACLHVRRGRSRAIPLSVLGIS